MAKPKGDIKALEAQIEALKAQVEALKEIDKAGKNAQKFVDDLLGGLKPVELKGPEFKGFKPIEFGGAGKPKRKQATREPARRRDYAAEYRRRKELGRHRGETLAEARGHRAERKGGVGASGELAPSRVPSYLDRLAERRSVKIVAYTEDGGVHVIGRGKPRALAQWMRETLAAGSLGASLKYTSEGLDIESIRVFFS